ncbi:SCO0930 family lipoprotein [Streptomyces sp. NPDC006733]|uniref:SCO0930 family lipoprotein n=1 Tax=Streptomyces sp. NPDC006733 TaxID=3155460 RepID=UPI0033C5B185
MNGKRAVLSGLVASAFLLTTACAGGGSDDVKVASAGSSKDAGYGSEYVPNSTASGSGPNSASSTKGPEASIAEVNELSAKNDPNQGTFVTDGEGFTLYRFDKDSPKPPASNCNGACAETWPAVRAEEVLAGKGIDKSLLGAVERSDGTRQLTLAGWPVYRYSKDKKAGDTNGKGVPNWSPIAPDGKKAKKEAPAEKDTTVVVAAAALVIVDNADLGKIFQDAFSRTLYRFDKDSAWPMKIGCLDACLKTWTPAKPVDAKKLRGISPKLIGTVTRPDGTKQLSINCWPVYTFAGDKKAGDINGQGKQGLWFAVTDSGKKAAAGR